MEITNKLFSYDHDMSIARLSLPVADIHQISELSIMRGTEIEEHTQYCDEITYAISGKATVYSGEDVCELHAGEIHFIKKGVCHKIVASKDENFRYICIGYTPNRSFLSLEHIFAELDANGHFEGADNGNMRILTEMLINESYIKNPDSDVMINAYMTQIITETARILRGINNRGNLKYNSDKSNFAIYHTLRYIDRNFLQIKCIADIAKKLSYSEYYLAHLFKEKMGISIKQYVQNRKIDAAKEFMKDERCTVNDIAEKLGYSTAHAFSQAFKRSTGVSPSEYKKANI